MYSIKGGTQVFSKAQQESSMKGDGRQTISAADHQKHFGDKDLGEILGKVTDPNWVDPRKVERQIGGDKLGKDAFLKMLLAQLKNQDPTSPLESHEMAAHLAQFSSLEKLEGINTGINSLVGAKKPAEKFQMLNMIGKAVSGDSSKIYRSDEVSDHTVNFNLLADAKEVELKVRDALGNIIRTVNMSELKKGDNEFVWNGVNEDGRKAGIGQYDVLITAKNDKGQKVHAGTSFEGRITGVNYTPEGPVLLIGNQSVRMSDVKKIIDPTLLKKKAPAKVQAPPQQPGAKPAAAQKSVESSMVNGGLSQVGMARGLMNKLNQQGGE